MTTSAGPPARSREGAKPAWTALAGILGALAAAVSASSATGTRPDEAELRRQLERRGVDAAAIVLPHALSPEIERWLEDSVPAGGTAEERLETLLELLLDRNELDLEYHQGRTGTAVETFSSRKANCLSFTHLFVGMARELGLAAYYLKVEDLQGFEREGDLVVVSGHVTAGFGPPARPMVLEFTIFPATEYRRFHPLSDLSAVALFYSNRGAELLLDGERERALEWLETAVRIDEELADAWNNLGVVLRRVDRLDEAEVAYRRALEEDPESTSALQNLSALLLQVEGREDEGRRLLALTDREENRNPFNYLALGDLSIERGRLDDAERYYRRALALAPDSAESRAALGQWHLASGRVGAARKWLRRALKSDPDEPRAQRLRRQLTEG